MDVDVERNTGVTYRQIVTILTLLHKSLNPSGPCLHIGVFIVEQ